MTPAQGSVVVHRDGHSGTVRIAMADDDPVDQEALRRAAVSGRVNVEFTFFPRGEGLLRYLHDMSTIEFLPNLVVLDLKMPDQSGVETLEAMRATPALTALPVVVFTGSDDPDDIQGAREAGATWVVQKPVTSEGLIEFARTLVDRAGGPSAN